MSGTEDRLIEAVGTELRLVTSKARQLTALRSLELPAIDRLLAARERERDDLQQLVPEAIARIDDPSYRAAARSLFPFPYSESDWPKLAVRGKEAAARFGVGYDSFRRGGADRSSRLDEVAQHVARVLISLPEEEQPAQGSSPLLTTGANRRGRRVPLREAAVGLLTLAVVAILLVALRERTEDASGRKAGCKGSVGDLTPELALEPDARAFAGRLRAAFDNAGGEFRLGCPAGEAYGWLATVVQEFRVAGVPNGALLVQPNDVDIYLNRAAWGSYHQLGGKDGSVAQTAGGHVVDIVEYADGHVEVELSTRTILVAEKADAPYFWIHAAFVPWWRSHPELGLPTSNPLASARQDFRNGIGVMSDGPPGTGPVARIVDSPETELPAIESLKGRIVSQVDGTAWYVDEGGTRHWIPDGEVWNCLGGDSQVAGDSVPGYAIATMPFGGHAHCAR